MLMIARLTHQGLGMMVIWKAPAALRQMIPIITVTVWGWSQLPRVVRDYQGRLRVIYCVATLCMKRAAHLTAAAQILTDGRANEYLMLLCLQLM